MFANAALLLLVAVVVRIAVAVEDGRNSRETERETDPDWKGYGENIIPMLHKEQNFPIGSDSIPYAYIRRPDVLSLGRDFDTFLPSPAIDGCGSVMKFTINATSMSNTIKQVGQRIIGEMKYNAFRCCR